MFTVSEVGVCRDESRCLQEWKSVFTVMKVGVYRSDSRCLHT